MKEKRRGKEKKDNPIKRKRRGQVDDHEEQEQKSSGSEIDN